MVQRVVANSDVVETFRVVVEREATDGNVWAAAGVIIKGIVT